MTERLSAPPLAGEHAILARRYVRLYGLAEQEGIVDTIAAELRGLGACGTKARNSAFSPSIPA